MPETMSGIFHISFQQKKGAKTKKKTIKQKKTLRCKSIDRIFWDLNSIRLSL